MGKQTLSVNFKLGLESLCRQIQKQLDETKVVPIIQKTTICVFPVFNNIIIIIYLMLLIFYNSTFVLIDVVLCTNRT